MPKKIIAALACLLVVGVTLIASSASATAASKSLGTCRGNSSVYTCVKVLKHLSDKFTVTGSDGEDNTTPQKHTLTCSIKKTSSITWGMSMKVSASVKAWIFASVSAEIGGNFSKSHGTETSVSTSMPVPARSTVMCYRGSEVKNYRVRKCTYSSHSSSCRTFTWHAPLGLIWRTTYRKD